MRVLQRRRCPAPPLPCRKSGGEARDGGVAEAAAHPAWYPRQASRRRRALLPPPATGAAELSMRPRTQALTKLACIK